MLCRYKLISHRENEVRKLRLDRHQLAYWSATDAGNRNMRQHRRKKWNEDDFNAAAKEMNRILGELKVSPASADPAPERTV